VGWNEFIPTFVWIGIVFISPNSINFFPTEILTRVLNKDPDIPNNSVLSS
jgi:hypothetical protein